MTKPQLIDSAIEKFISMNYEFEIFKDNVSQFFLKSPSLVNVVHSVKSRLKDIDHLRDKIERKWTEENPISEENVFNKITDLAGVRVLHLYQDQFPLIHSEILRKVTCHDWALDEDPIAYTWDPESVDFFKGLGLDVKRKESFYTSIHYVIRPRSDSPISCEVQVRTLFEEIWGEVDHILNYPIKTKITPCQEQILVLAKLVGAGSRLVDSIFRASKQIAE